MTITSARVRELSAKATGGEWSWEDGPPTLYAGRGSFGAIANFPIPVPAHGLNLLGRLEPDSNGPANLDLIAALCSEPARARIAKALALLEAVEGQDAGLVRAMSVAIGNPASDGENDYLPEPDAWEPEARAALAALVGEG